MRFCATLSHKVVLVKTVVVKNKRLCARDEDRLLFEYCDQCLFCLWEVKGIFSGRNLYKLEML